MIKNIGFGQFDVTFGDKQANFAHVASLAEKSPAVDILVLPELCFTGYEFHDVNEVATLAEPLGEGPTSDFMRVLSSQLNAICIAGYAECHGNTYYNSAMMVTPTGQFFNYRKIHLFSRENDLFSPGDQPPQVYDTPAGRIGMMICFDWFFPETARTLALAGAQVIAHPSNLVLPWCQRAMFARSVENHVYSITANRTGIESRTGRTLIFTGASQVLAPDGKSLAVADTTGSVIQTASCDLAAADNKQINPYNNLFGSRRVDLYNLE